MSKITDGTGNAFEAEVDKDHNLHTRAITESLQHNISKTSQKSFQVNAEASITNTEQTLLVVKNTDDKPLIVTFIRVESVEAIEDATAFFNIKLGGDYTSGGTNIIPTNMFVDSPISAQGTFVGVSTPIVLSGTQTQIDRTYKGNSPVTYEKKSVLILPKNSILTISHKGSTAVGTAYCRVSFYYN